MTAAPAPTPTIEMRIGDDDVAHGFWPGAERSICGGAAHTDRIAMDHPECASCAACVALVTGRAVPAGVRL